MKVTSIRVLQETKDKLKEVMARKVNGRRQWRSADDLIYALLCEVKS